MLTYEQATYFLEKILRMPSTWKDLLFQDPLDFLSLYMKHHAVRVPFQNMYMATVEETKRWFPSEEEILENGLCGHGGCCFHLNWFTKCLLQAIGMDAFAVRGDHFCAPVAGTHCMAMVRLHGPKDFGTYMIEVGGAYPMLVPVPMDKEKLPYTTLQAAGFPYEFREIGQGWIAKFHIGGGIMGGKFNDKTEVMRTAWNLQPRAIWEFDYTMMETFTNPAVSLILKAPVLVRHLTDSQFRRLCPPEVMENGIAEHIDMNNMLIRPEANKTNHSSKNSEASRHAVHKSVELDNQHELSELGDPKNFVFVYKRRLVIGDAYSRKVIKNYETFSDMAIDLKKFLPEIPESVIEKAINVFNKYEVKPHPYDNIL